MCDYGVSCCPFEKIRANHLLRGGRNDRVDICSVAHKLASNLRRLERSNTTRHEKGDFLSNQFSTLGGDDVLGRMAQGSRPYLFNFPVSYAESNSSINSLRVYFPALAGIL